MPCTCLVILAVAPVPMAIRATTAPTPMMMPSMVRAERSLLAASARRAMRKFSAKFIVYASGVGGFFVQSLFTGPRRTCRQRVRDDFVANDHTVGNAHNPV